MTTSDLFGIIGVRKAARQRYSYETDREPEILTDRGGVRAGDDGVLEKFLEENLALVDLQREKDGSTPLMAACIDENESLVDALLRHKADQTLADSDGWTAREHAVFRGRFGIAEKLTPKNLTDTNHGLKNSSRQLTVASTFAFAKDQSHVVLNLGVTQVGQENIAIDLQGLEAFAEDEIHLEISCSQSPGVRHTLPIPYTQDLIESTATFPLQDASKARLTLRIMKKGSPIGIGTAILSNEKNSYGMNRESLIREQAVPILNAKTLDFMGAVTVTLLIAHPYPHLKEPRFDAQEHLCPPRLVGHRGLGMNDTNKDWLQMGENTVHSFVAASQVGATFVEFDVQVTRDLVPVLLHNYALSETGTDVPVHELTYEQFMHVSEGHTTHRGRPRASSDTRGPDQLAEAVRHRMKYSTEYLQRGFKANTRGDYIHSSFSTLASALAEVPEDVSFNIEIKYPRRFEAQSLSLSPVVLEINTFVDAILDAIHTQPKNRNRKIILSSFTPDVCILLSLKQKAYPVFLISNVGKPPMFDKEVRGASIEVAVKFAKAWGLQGVVFLADALVMCPRLVGWIKMQGLVLGCYGSGNQKVENVQLLLDAGVDLIFTDRVARINHAFRDRFVHEP